jgi:hypothetical protein
MADVVLTRRQVVPPPGLTPAYQALDNVDTYYADRDERVFLHFLNTNAGAATITFDTEQQVEGLDLENPTITVPATTGDVMVRLSSIAEVSAGTHAGRLKFTCDLATGVTCQATRV